MELGPLSGEEAIEACSPADGSLLMVSRGNPIVWASSWCLVQVVLEIGSDCLEYPWCDVVAAIEFAQGFK